MKIAQVVCTFPPYKGGIGNVVQTQLDLLRKEGHEVDVFTPKYQNTDQSQDGVYRLMPLLRLGNAALLWQLFFKLRRYDLVYLHYPFYGSAEVVFFSRLIFGSKFKLVTHYHMDTMDLGFIKKFFTLPNYMIKTSLFKLSDKIICASLDYIADSQIKKIYHEYPKKFLEVPFEVDTDTFGPAYKNKGRVIGFVGGMDEAHDFKGVDVLIKAFAGLKDQNVILHLIGRGELTKKYKGLAKELKVSDRVIFFEDINDQSDLVASYQKMDIFVLPSINNHEAFGIVLLEAMSCGLPLIASSLRGVRTVFNAGEQGFYVKPNEIADLQDKLNTLLADHDLREKMSKESRHLALSRYSLGKNNKKIIDLLDEYSNNK